MKLELIKNLGQTELRILQTIYEWGPISRVSLARELGLTRGTITTIIKKLINLDLVGEVGKGASSSRRGRREVLLHMNPDAGYVISIHIALSYLSFGIVNLNGQIIAKETQHFEQGAGPETVLEPMFEGLTAMLSERGLSQKAIFGIGLAIPGIIDYEAGVVKVQTLEGWIQYPLREQIERRLGIDVYLENDVKAITLGEYQFGTGNHVRNMVCLWLEDGIGVGIINNGHLIRGVTSSAGEIGFNQFILDMPSQKSILIPEKPKYYGDLLSFTNIRATIRRGLAQGWDSVLQHDAEIEDFFTAAEQGDPLAIYITRLFGKYVGTVCMNQIYAFNPQVLLLSGPLFHRLPLLVQEINMYLNKAPLQMPIAAAEVRTSTIGEDSVSIGCAALVLDHLFHASVVNFSR